MKFRFLAYLFFAFIIFGCRQRVKFDGKSWKEAKGFDKSLGYDRDMMIDDLIKSHNFKGMSYSQITDLLGGPDFGDSSEVSYIIKEDYGSDIDPISSKDLVFKLNKDSIVTDAKVTEWKK